MAISENLTKMANDISDCYAAVKEKNGTVPTDKNLDNLPSAIRSIQAAGANLLSFTCIEEGSTIQVVVNGTLANEAGIAYNKNNEGWIQLFKGTTGSSDTITLQNGDKVEMLNASSTLSDKANYLSIRTTGKFNLAGSVMAMIGFNEFDEDEEQTSPYAYCFNYLFDGGSTGGGIVDCSGLRLPSEFVPYGCYNMMFNNNPYLTIPPTCSAKNKLLSYSCSAMFRNCSSLKRTMNLDSSITSVGDNTFSNMYLNCDDIVVNNHDFSNITTVGNASFGNMFRGCTNLPNVSPLPNITTLTTGLFTNMYNGCSAIVTVPSTYISAFTDLTSSCFNAMFKDCTSLKEPPEFNTYITSTAAGCCVNMFNGCNALKIQTNDPGVQGGKILTTPATITTSQWSNMFTGTGGTFTGTPAAATHYYWLKY